jgi:hypothetical protein
MSLRKFVHRSHLGQKKRREDRGYTTRRLHFERFEDRRMLSFTPAVNLADVAYPSAIVAADFNRDGNLDLATAGNGNVRVRLGNGAGGFGEAQLYAAGSPFGPYHLEVADFNGDTFLDIFEVYDDAAVGTSLLMGNGDGTFQSAAFTFSPWLEITAVAVGHFNNDDNMDIAVSLFEWDTNGGRFQVRLGDGQGGFTGSENDPYQSSLSPVDEALAVDINNDGKLDVVTAGVTVLLGNGDGTLSSETYYPAGTGGSPRAVAAGNFTDDEFSDVIVAGTTVAVLRGNGDGIFQAPIHSFANGTSHSAMATADFNGDGKLDAIMTDDDAGAVSLMLGNGDGTLQHAGTFATGSLPSDIAVGDFNRDGRPDVAVANRLSNTISVLLNDNVWQQGSALPGDYNRNGEVDAADQVVWRKVLGTIVTPYTGADGNGNGVVDQDDYGVWRAHFGQTSPPPIAGSDKSVAAEMNLSSPRASDAKQAVEVRGAGETQRAKLTRDSAFVDLAAPPARSRAEFRHTLRTSSAATASIEDNRRNIAVLSGLSKADSEPAPWPKGKLVEFDLTNDAGDSVLGTVDEVFAQIISDWAGASPINSTAR